MQFYTNSHTHYCGVDLHTKTLFICILDNSGKILMHKNILAKPKPFLKAISSYREDIIVGVKCMFSWCWLASLCIQNNIAFILGYALYMKCIYGGRTKSDKIDSENIARLIRGGNFPLAYTYPPALRTVRDLLRCRCNLLCYRSELLAYIKITHHQYNADIISKNIIKKCRREDLVERFDNPHTQKNVEMDVRLCDLLHRQIC